MNEQKEHIVVLLDVLGFENLFYKIGLEQIEIRYNELIEVVKQHNYEFAITIGPGGHPMVGNPGIKSAYFSDSLIFWCPYDIFRMEIMFYNLQEILCKSIEIGLPLRGSISVGKVKIDKEKGIYLGEPIIKAARAERVQEWIGITLSKTFDIEPYSGGFKADVILNYEKHLKKDKNPMDKVIPLVIDFPRHWRKKRKTSLIDAINKLDTDKNFSKYYSNTIDFVKYSEENHDWWKKDPKFIKDLEKNEKKVKPAVNKVYKSLGNK